MSDSTTDSTEPPPRERKTEYGSVSLPPCHVYRETIDALIEIMSKLGPVELGHGAYKYRSLDVLIRDAGLTLKSLDLRVFFGASVSVDMTQDRHHFFRSGSSDDRETACWHSVLEETKRASPWYRPLMNRWHPWISTFVFGLMFSLYALLLDTIYGAGSKVPMTVVGILYALGGLAGLSVVWLVGAWTYRRTRKIYLARSHERGSFYKRNQRLIDGLVIAVIGLVAGYILRHFFGGSGEEVIPVPSP